MLCHAQLRPAFKKQRRAGARRDTLEIDGTWDFKWPRDSVIKVAFQKPRADDELLTAAFEESIDRVVELASQWQTRVEVERAATAGRRTVSLVQEGLVPLTLRFLQGEGLYLPPPTPASGGASSVFPPPGITLGAETLVYDVLISMAALPVTLPPTAGRSRPDRIDFSRAELGTYAERLDYGTPSAFIGVYQPGVDPREFYKSIEGRYIVVHEVGHILGLPHGHQQPEVVLDWRDDAEIVELLKVAFEPAGNRGRTAVQIDGDLKEFAATQLRARLEAPVGKSFSDLRIDPLDSVMTYPLIKYLVKGSPPLVSRKALIHEHQPRPTDADIRHLQRMYTADGRL
jgi:hypothetical protein